METRKTYGLRGPVRTCILERKNSGWSDRHVSEFHHDGRISSGSVTNNNGSGFTFTYRYDERGRLVSYSSQNFTRIHHYDHADRVTHVTVVETSSPEVVVERYEYAADGSKKRTVRIASNSSTHLFHVEGGEAGYPTHGATSMLTLYDTAGKPLETQFLDDSGNITNRIVLRYNERGLVVEETQISSGNDMLAHLPVEHRNDTVIEMIRSRYANATRRLYHYDEDGRKIKKEMSSFGGLSESLELITYNEQGDPASHTFEKHNKTAGPPFQRSESRTLYEYDSHRNWIVKTLEGGDLLETRQITYWPDDAPASPHSQASQRLP